jgi:heptosyltransferase I
MRVLLVKLSAIGDVVHTLPAAAYLRKALPNACIAWVVERRAAALLKDTPAIDELIEIDTRTLRKNPFSGNAVREQLRQLRGSSPPDGFDIAIDFQGLIKSGMVAKASAAPRRFGFETCELREPLSRVFLTEQVQTAYAHHIIEKSSPSPSPSKTKPMSRRMPSVASRGSPSSTPAAAGQRSSGGRRDTRRSPIGCGRNTA